MNESQELLKLAKEVLGGRDGYDIFFKIEKVVRYRGDAEKKTKRESVSELWRAFTTIDSVREREDDYSRRPQKTSMSSRTFEAEYYSRNDYEEIWITATISRQDGKSWTNEDENLLKKFR